MTDTSMEHRSAASYVEGTMETIVTTYANTVFDFDGLGTLDLRDPVGARERTLLAAAGLHGTFAVLSAFPAFGAARDESRAALRSHRLRGLIGLHGVPAIPLLARSPDGVHHGARHRTLLRAGRTLLVRRRTLLDPLDERTPDDGAALGYSLKGA